MKLFFFYQRIGELQSRADIRGAYAVFLSDFVEAHPAGETADNSGHWNARAADDGLAVLLFGIDFDAIVRAHFNHSSRRSPISP